jgi:hypothetical protein
MGRLSRGRRAPAVLMLPLVGVLGCSRTATRAEPGPVAAGDAADEGGRTGPVATPRELWNRFLATAPPFTFTIEKDEVVQSDTDPRKRLRRIEVKFYSQEIDGKPVGHPSVIFMPADPRVYEAPERRGKVVVVANRSLDNPPNGSWRQAFLGSYGEPIAARTDYPTMVLAVPGEYDGTGGREISIRPLADKVLETKDPFDHNYFRLAIPYLRALDVFAEILGEPKIRAVIGGHSKRATSAYTAAAIDPERIVGVVYMGNETVFSEANQHDGHPAIDMDRTSLAGLSPWNSQKDVAARVLYLGATNEGGYQMFAIDRIQERLKSPWTIAYLPNYRHWDQSEVQFLDWQMWVAHVFDGRPITRISDPGREDTAEGTIFHARIDSPNKIITVQVWYVYTDDVPYWRDLYWYSDLMSPTDGGLYQASVSGKTPDAWLVEVKDTAGGFPGYVTTLPLDITHKPTARRDPSGGRGRVWEPKHPE